MSRRAKAYARRMKRLVLLLSLAVALFFGGWKWNSSPAHATSGHEVQIVTPAEAPAFEVGPAQGDVTVDGWTWDE
jgi:hypothetical protein